VFHQSFTKSLIRNAETLAFKITIVRSESRSGYKNSFSEDLIHCNSKIVGNSFSAVTVFKARMPSSIKIYTSFSPILGISFSFFMS